MKKLLSILIIAVILISVCSISVSAYTELVRSYEEFPEVENKYYDRVVEYNFNNEPTSGYREFHHYSSDTDEEPDWALIFYSYCPPPWEARYGTLVGDRVIWSIAGTGFNEFNSGYAVYIPEIDTFYALSNGNMKKIIEQCPEFVETFEELGIGQLMGDVDDNDTIDILDSTYIQREVAGYFDFLTLNQFIDGQGNSSYVSVCDYDRDGEVTVMDATTIQKELANIEDSTVAE